MKQTLLSSIFSLVIWSISFGQITINSGDYFPVPGDTLRTTTAFFPNVNFDPQTTGQQMWDFSSLPVGFIRERLVLDASEGNASGIYPDAEVVIRDSENAEEYHNVTNEFMEVIGYFGSDPIGFGIDVNAGLEKPILDRHAPLTFGDVMMSSSAFRIEIAWDDLPTEFLDTLGSLPIEPDSIAVEFAGDRTDVVDAWGSMEIPRGSFEVLREKRVENRSTVILAKVPILGWIDVTDLIPFSGLGDATLVSYYFFSADAKEPIAVVNMNAANDTVNNIAFKYIPITVSSSADVVKDAHRADVMALPNPAILYARFYFSHVEPGNYSLRIYNLLGLPVWENNYTINSGNQMVKENLYDLNPGTYVYSLIDDNGKVLVTKKLVIARP